MPCGVDTYTNLSEIFNCMHVNRNFIQQKNGEQVLLCVCGTHMLEGVVPGVVVVPTWMYVSRYSPCCMSLYVIVMYYSIYFVLKNLKQAENIVNWNKSIYTKYSFWLRYYVNQKTISIKIVSNIG